MGKFRVPGPISKLAERLLALKDVTYTPPDDLELQSTFRLSLPKLLLGSLTNVPLSSGTVPGTAPGKEKDPYNQSTLKLVRPQLALNLADGNITGRTVLSIPSGYPETLAGPTEIDVNLTSTKFDFSSFSLPTATLQGNASWGPISSEFRLEMNYDTQRFAQIVGPTLSGDQKLSDALGGMKNELLHPGFDFSAVVKLALPLIGKIPITHIAARAASTVPLQRRLTGAPAPFALDYRLYGLVPTPPGSLFDVPALGIGLTQGSFSASRGYSLTAAFLPTFSPTALSSGASSLEKFPVYGYLELYGVRRVSSGLELGARLTVSPSSVDIANLRGGNRPQSNILNDYKDSLNVGSPSDIKGMIYFRLEGKFDAF